MTHVDILDELDGMQAIIFAIETPKDPDQYDKFFKFPNAVILDADYSHIEITPGSKDDDYNDEQVKKPIKDIDVPMPPFPGEATLLKQLHIIKNRKMTHYNKVYQEDTHPEEYDEENFVVNQVREAIFRYGFLPFLEAAYKTIKPKKQSPKFLSEFWNKKSYFEYIEENFEPPHEYIKFAESLIAGTSFTRFMDGFIFDDLSNFDVCNSILCGYGILKMRYKDSCSSVHMFSSTVSAKLKDQQKKVHDYISRTEAHLKDPRLAFNDEVVRFNFKLPSFVQRQMLVEKIFFLLEKHKAKKDKYAISSVHDHSNKKSEEYQRIIDHKKVKYQYDFIVHTVKRVYEYLENEDKKVAEVQQVQIRKDIPDFSKTPRF